MIRMRRSFIILTVAGLSALAAPALGQSSGTTSEFSYSPGAQQRGGSVTITGKCVIEGQTSNVDMIVTVREGPDGQGDYGFSKAFIPSENGNINGTIEVPGDAPFGDYAIGGACRNGPTVFFSKNGPFAVVERASQVTTTTAPAVTTTTAPGATTTTSTTVPGATTTSTTVEIVAVPGTIDDDTDGSGETTQTTIDEFAGTRNEDDDSIGPLLILIGVLPLLLAVAAIVVAMRRRSAPDPTAPTPDA
ncbi:MAG: hypothetical protein Q8K63_12215 [Acidimicrobiales bacterium]|nr:hypothetical protein [Acidimicrobiales bacterium]